MMATATPLHHFTRTCTLTILLVASSACSGSEPAEPTSAPASGGDRAALHDALVATHRQAVNECFGGFGKGMPYSVELTIEGGSVKAVAAASLAEKYPDLPKECVDKVYRSMAVPGSTGASTVRARLAVKNPGCTEPACPDAADLKCQFARDVRCSVVIDSP
jgi:hypothetical protein